MSARDADCAGLAAAMGWMLTRVGKEQAFDPDPDGPDLIPIPAPDAPLPEQLEFCGRIAEELPEFRIQDIHERHDRGWLVQFVRRDMASYTEWKEAPDLAHAAVRAAIAAKGAT